MFNVITPGAYDPQMSFARPQPDDAALAYWLRAYGAECDAVAAACSDDGVLLFPTCADFTHADLTYLFSVEGRRFWLVRGADGKEPVFPGDFRPVPVRSFLGPHATPAGLAAITGLHLASWYETRVFCGRCSARMEHSKSERALVCPACGTVEYPKISPAIIVAVTDGDKLLMTRYAAGGYRRRALVAGFVEIGETAEEAVAREVLEECGLRVKDVRYRASQPWGLSGSLMLGFSAKLDGSPQIELRDGELSWAGWVGRDEIGGPENYELGGTLIEAFREGKLD
ncbi:MAG: NAD(+) diphosphatase [Eggerthellaceae bacterium]|nr:NAD(+) diphosphatase [Eggerthellaceae bacterium]